MGDGAREARAGGLRRWAVPLVALAAVALRLLALPAPLGADEAGFTLVGRSWDPQPDSVYGPYFVDRAPLLIAVYGGADAIGDPRLIRVVGALACGVLVLTAAATAHLVAGARSARWTAVCVAAVVTNPLITLGAVKGELLALPFVMAGCWLALLALRDRSGRLAFLSGLVAGVAPHLKQSLLGGLVFAAALTVAVVATDRLPARSALRLAGCGLAGVLAPVAATLAWALAAGVEPLTLWDTVVGFRADASGVLAADTSEAAEERAVVLAVAGVLAGLAFVIGGFLVAVRDSWADHRPVTVATLAMLAYDLLAVVLGGSYWRDYLYGLVPAAALAAALVARRSDLHGRRMRLVVVLAAVSSAVFIVSAAVPQAIRPAVTAGAATGEAIAAVAEPGDTLVVHGGRADIQLTSGLASPYPHLWSLPMRTLDPDRSRLVALLAGPEAPTWLVAWVGLDGWGDPSQSRLGRTVAVYYDRHGTGCAGRAIYLRHDVERPVPRPDCSRDHIIRVGTSPVKPSTGRSRKPSDSTAASRMRSMRNDLTSSRSRSQTRAYHRGRL